MKRYLHILLVLLFTIVLISTHPTAALASPGDDEHAMEMEVHGYHVTLLSQNEWKKGENTIVVTLMDSMGMPVQGADVEILVGHTESESEGHAAPEADVHAPEPQGHDSMPGMDMSESVEEADTHETSAHEAPSHGEEEASSSIAMRAADEQGTYVAETHLDASGEHEVLVMFHVNGEMIEAAFTVEIPASNSKYIVLWSFALINMALIASAGFIKKQSISVKGAK